MLASGLAVLMTAVVGVHAASFEAGWAILQQRCLECHGPEKHKSGYRLNDRETALSGGDSGTRAIIVSNSAASALVQRLLTTNRDERMPPKGEALSAGEVAAVKLWIDSGAAWPAAVAVKPADPQKHWAFVAPTRTPVPLLENRNSKVLNAIDPFILTRLERERLKPSPEAQRATLIRRVHLDLTGLLPTPEQVVAFEKDRRGDAYLRVVDELLASPHFGERWGRHWLDLARYADSAGYQIDRVRPGAYLFRDWVIDSLNRDQPFDQFTMEQIAGDLLPDATLEQRIATGFHRMTLSNHEDGVDAAEYASKARVDRVATTGTAWLGLTLGCAECHSHKFDPVSQREFYRLYAFFNEAQELDVPAPQPGEREKYELARKHWEQEKARLEEARSRYADGEAQTNFVRWQRGVDRGGMSGAVTDVLDLPAEQRSAAQKRALWKHYRKLDPGLKEFAARLKAHQRLAPRYRGEEALLLAARTNAPKTFVHVRGDFLRPGEEVQPGVLRVLNRFECDGQPTRLDLARWIVSPENPLTARVAVNHLWLHLFGRGLVNTPEDFGLRGEAPSHPELLDWLATEFQRHGWSRKQLIRLIVTSATYRQSSEVRADLRHRDPQNILLARQNRLRVESEIVRDLFLDAGGLLNRELGGASIYPVIPKDVKAAGYGVGGTWTETEGSAKHRRGVYVAVRRTVPYPISATFDGANPSECTAQRERSNTPLQPLALLNNPVFAEATEAFGQRVTALPGNPRAKLDAAFRICFSREPARVELKRLEQLYREASALSASKEGGTARAASGVGADLSRSARLSTMSTIGEPQAWRAVAEVMLNLDEFLTRE